MHFEVHTFAFYVDLRFRPFLTQMAGIVIDRYFAIFEKVVLVLSNLCISTEEDQRAKHFETELFDLD